MKKFVLFALFALTGCVDITHYVSFNDKEQTVSSVRVVVSSALLEAGTDTEELEKKFADFTNKNRTNKILKNSKVKTAAAMISNTAVFGVEERFTAPKHYFADESQPLFPVKEPYGFSIYFGSSFKETSEELEDSGGEEAAAIVSVMFKYRVLLSKADLPRPLLKVVLKSSAGSDVEAPITDYGVMYMIEIPFSVFMGDNPKAEFHFSPK